ncbi:PREDICTED: organic solute transporter subunit alpha-like [Branchiostoma belcheri]|uniref:Organic solute transporter subunit alpha-like n=1 Tax=Branchiostoma belcheri TaxID=7741 RepID=A0A6P4ZR85_BRABE|nr:PREDICTED: organic solute transporter subunit alpha-like [Branchiostoma belcheri]
MLNCSEETPQAAEYLQQLGQAEEAIIVSATFVTFFTLFLFMEELCFATRRLPGRNTRNRIVWILGTYPVFSLTSLMSLYIPRSNLIGGFAANIYFAVAVYQFFMLIVDYFGGDEELVTTLSGLKVSLRRPPCCCCCCCLPQVDMTLGTLGRLKLAVMQMAIMRPILYFIALVTWSDGKYGLGQMESGPSVNNFVEGLETISTLFGIYGFVVLQPCVTKPLKGKSISLKNLLVQIAAALAGIQKMLLSLLASFRVIPCGPQFSAKTRADYIHNCLIILEMMVAALVARWVFTRNDHDVLLPIPSTDTDVEDPIQLEGKEKEKLQSKAEERAHCLSCGEKKTSKSSGDLKPKAEANGGPGGVAHWKKRHRPAPARSEGDLHYVKLRNDTDLLQYKADIPSLPNSDVKTQHCDCSGGENSETGHDSAEELEPPVHSSEDLRAIQAKHDLPDDGDREQEGVWLMTNSERGRERRNSSTV